MLLGCTTGAHLLSTASTASEARRRCCFIVLLTPRLSREFLAILVKISALILSLNLSVGLAALVQRANVKA